MDINVILSIDEFSWLPLADDVNRKAIASTSRRWVLSFVTNQRGIVECADMWELFQMIKFNLFLYSI